MHFARSVALALITLVVASIADIANASAPVGRERPASPAFFDYGGVIDVNQIRMGVTNTGSFASDRITGNAGLEFPNGSFKTAVYTAGLWLGAHVGASLRVAVSEYSDEFRPGSMIGGLPDDPNLAAYKVFKLDRVYPDDASRDAALADYTFGAVPHGAPVVLVLPDGSLDILGDQMLWAVYNDAEPAAHNGNPGGTDPLGVEVQQTTFAFNRPGPLGKTVFIRFKIVNRGSNSLDDLIFGMWSDPDVGTFFDDHVGCDTPRDVGYAYNATNNDGIYGSAPPAVGHVLLRGPTPTGGLPLAMTAFTAYLNGTDPSSAAEAYHRLEGLNADGTPIIDPTTTLATRYMYSGNPVAGIGWIDPSAVDRRLLVASGPIHMGPGDEQLIDCAIVIGQGNDRLSSVTAMLCAVDGVRNFYAQGFQPPHPDAACDDPTPTLASLVDAHAEPDRVTLSWYGADVAGRLVTIERRTAEIGWSAVDSRFANGSGSVAFEDRNVAAGVRYGYRIGVRTDGADRYSAETWIEVPVEAGLSLAGFRPNPAAGEVFVEFSLPSTGPASLRVFDIAGRAIFTREVGGLGAGRHQIRLDGGAALRAGAYVMQISQGGRMVTRRGVIVR
jgi:hypothetical protein